MKPKVAIIDYGLGNLFSIKNACEKTGLDASITNSGSEILSADAVILPGVGAFGDAMAKLENLGINETIYKAVDKGKTVVGICLGMQLLMDKSFEFGEHKGLGLIKGEVVRFENGQGDKAVKVPQVGWNKIRPAREGNWENSLLKGIKQEEYMYFVHSFYTVPVNKGVELSKTTYGGIEFCSSLRKGDNVFGFQFHPERSGKAGLHLYKNLADNLIK